MIVSQGARFGGWSFYALKGKLKYCYNLVGVHFTYVESATPMRAGEHQVRMEFAYDGGGGGKGGAITLYVDGTEVGTGRLEQSQAYTFSLDETTDVGQDTGTSVSEDFKAHHETVFNGEVEWVQIDIDKAAADKDHLIGPEERFKIAVARQ